MGEKPKDLESMWRDTLVDWERNLNAFANKAMGDSAFAKTFQQTSSAGLTAKSAFNDAMKQHWETMNLASRDDLEALGQRLQPIEEDIRTIKTLLYRLVGEAPRSADPWPKPSRTRKPPKR